MTKSTGLAKQGFTAARARMIVPKRNHFILSPSYKAMTQYESLMRLSAITSLHRLKNLLHLSTFNSNITKQVRLTFYVHSAFFHHLNGTYLVRNCVSHFHSVQLSPFFFVYNLTFNGAVIHPFKASTPTRRLV